MKACKALIILFLASAVYATSVLAASTEERASAYRSGAFRMVAWHLKPLGAMAKGNLDFDAATAATNAKAIATLADFPQNAFIDGSSSDDIKTRAKPGIWKNRDDFDVKMQDFVKAAKALPEGVGSLESLQAAVGAVGKTCKGCHQDFRHKKD